MAVITSEKHIQKAQIQHSKYNIQKYYDIPKVFLYVVSVKCFTDSYLKLKTFR